MEAELLLSKVKVQKESLINSKLKDLNYRISMLKKLKTNILDMEDEICQALKIDLNKSASESYMTEIGMVLSEISYMVKNVKKFAKKQKVKTSLSLFPAKSYKLPCAYGQVLILSPWNYPFMLTLIPLIDAVSAGNSVVLKPSEFSTQTQQIIKKLIDKTFNDEEVYTVIGGKEDAELLLEQDFDYVFFTGSTKVGKIVLKKTAERFIPVTLELGGKSPCIVDESANLKLSAKRIIFGKCLNAGQTCIAPDYVLCDKKIKTQLIEELKKQIVLQYGENPLKNDNYPKLVNKKQFESSKKLIDEKNLIYGGRFDEKSLKIEPTLISSTFDEQPMQEEIFGPILPIVEYNTFDEAIKKVNSLNKPLALYLFSYSRENIDKVIEDCDFGGGCINDTISHIVSNELPFGGLKQSGIGAYHGKTGFDTFTHYKSVVEKGTKIDLSMRYQPITKKDDKIIKKFLK